MAAHHILRVKLLAEDPEDDEDNEHDEDDDDAGSPQIVFPPERLPAGSTPPTPAVFVRFDVPLARLAETLAECERRALAHERRRGLLLRALPLMLIASAMLWPLVDLAAGLGQLGFTRFVPLLVAGTLLVPWALARRSGEPDGPAAVLWRGLGRAGLALLVLATFVGLIAFSFQGLTWWLGVMALIVIGPALSLVAGLVSRRHLLHAVRDDLRLQWARSWGPPAWQSPLADLRALVQALEPQAVRSACARGWLDLSGPVQPWKQLPYTTYGTTLSDTGVRHFRDHWLFLEVALQGGSRLRLHAIERVTVDRRLPSLDVEVEARRAEHTAWRRSTVIVRLDGMRHSAKQAPPSTSALAALGLQRTHVRAGRVLAEWPAPARSLRPEALLAAVRGLLRALDRPQAELGRPWA